MPRRCVAAATQRLARERALNGAPEEVERRRHRMGAVGRVEQRRVVIREAGAAPAGMASEPVTDARGAPPRHVQLPPHRGAVQGTQGAARARQVPHAARIQEGIDVEHKLERQRRERLASSHRSSACDRLSGVAGSLGGCTRRARHN